jgi:hypothetical protein
MSDLSEIWVIWVRGYGRFDFDGSEAEAEEMRAHKAKWERAVAHKYRKSLRLESDRITSQIVDKFSNGEGVAASLFNKLKEAKEKEAYFFRENREAQ